MNFINLKSRIILEGYYEPLKMPRESHWEKKILLKTKDTSEKTQEMGNFEIANELDGYNLFYSEIKFISRMRRWGFKKFQSISNSETHAYITKNYFFLRFSEAPFIILKSLKNFGNFFIFRKKYYALLEKWILEKYWEPFLKWPEIDVGDILTLVG